MLLRRLFYSLFLFVSVNVGAQFSAVDPFFSFGAQSMARAGATVASEAVSDSFQLNPAAPSFANLYFLGGNYFSEGNSLSATIVDTQSGKLGGAVSYARRKFKSSAPEDLALGNFKRAEEKVVLSLFAKSNEQLAFGVGGKWGYRRSHQSGVDSGTEWNGDAGLLYKLTPQLSLGVSALNLLGGDKALFLTHYNLGAEYRKESFALSAQVTKFQKPDEDSGLAIPEEGSLVYAFSAEYVYLKKYAFRVGYRENQAWELKYATAGFGAKSEKFNLDYAFVMLFGGDLKEEDKSYHSVALGMLL